MRGKFVILFLALQIMFFLLPCYSQTKKNDFKTLTKSTNQIDGNINISNDSTREYIQTFLKLVIKEQKLDTSYQLFKKPAEFLDYNKDDEGFLKKYLIQIDTTHKDLENEKLTSSWPAQPKCLTKEDIELMLQQKAKLKTMAWNVNEFDFAIFNKNNWYEFSVPLFSKNYTIAIVGIYHGCPGLCGTGEVLMFTKKDSKWESQIIDHWVH